MADLLSVSQTNLELFILRRLDADHCYSTLKYLAGDRLNVEIVRGLLRSLRARGLVSYGCGLFNDDGECFGSGYAITEAGCTFLVTFEQNEAGGHEAGVQAIARERARQVEQEGWSADHDDAYDAGTLAVAAATYALSAGCELNPHWGQGIQQDELPDYWPFNSAWWKPTDPRTDLVKAGALIAAEIDRIDREAKREGAGQ